MTETHAVYITFNIFTTELCQIQKLYMHLTGIRKKVWKSLKASSTSFPSIGIVLTNNLGRKNILEKNPSNLSASVKATFLIGSTYVKANNVARCWTKILSKFNSS